MENKYENIDPQNEQIYNLIHEEFQKENIRDEIRLMVSNKIKNTDFNALGGFAKLTSAFGNGIYYMLGVILVAGALSVYYFASQDTVEKISDKSVVNQVQAKIYEQSLQTSQLEKSVDKNSSNSSKLQHESLIASNDNKIVNKSSSSETLTIETQEYQHSQTIKINSNLTDQFVIDSFVEIMNSLDLKFVNIKSNSSIIVKSIKVCGSYDNMNVEYYITLKFSKVDRNKIIATLNYIESSAQNSKFDIKQLFYDNLSSELQKHF